MLQYEELRLKLKELEPVIEELAQSMGYEVLKNELMELEEKTAAEGFWNDVDNSQKILKKVSSLKNKINEVDELKGLFSDTLTLIEMAVEEQDLSLLEEITEGVDKIEKEIERLKLSTLLTGEYDGNNAILSFHAGAGGTEAMDWVMMLYRMYVRWGERHGYKVKVMDMLEGEEAGIKSASILVEGQNAYGYLKSESGVHRLVRVSPFDASGRRHTSFASVEVLPEIADDMDIDIKEEDLKIDTFRSGGAGGQHVNKTESAIRITHIPTGIVVACQNERSQHQNREVAMKILKSKLLEIKEREHLERIEDIKGDQKDIAWGSQIRSYVFMPYTLVKDHRTGFEMGNINAVMDGEIDGFINAYLKNLNLGKL